MRCTMPASGVSLPSRTCRSVDFPRPFSPMIAIRELGVTVRFTWFSTRVAPRITETSVAMSWARCRAGRWVGGVSILHPSRWRTKWSARRRRVRD